MPTYVVDWASQGQSIVSAASPEDARAAFKEDLSFYLDDEDEYQIIHVEEVHFE